MFWRRSLRPLRSFAAMLHLLRADDARGAVPEEQKFLAGHLRRRLGDNLPGWAGSGGRWCPAFRRFLGGVFFRALHGKRLKPGHQRWRG